MKPADAPWINFLEPKTINLFSPCRGIARLKDPPPSLTDMSHPQKKTHNYCGTLLIQFTAVIFWPRIPNQNYTYSRYHFHYSRQYSPKTSRSAQITSTGTLSLSLTRRLGASLDLVLKPLTESWDQRHCPSRKYYQMPSSNLLSSSWPLLKKWWHRLWRHLYSRLCGEVEGWSLKSRRC